jgi:hypothetical protein
MMRLRYLIPVLAAFVLAGCSKNEPLPSGNDYAEASFSVALSNEAATKVDGVSEAASVDKLDVFVYDANNVWLNTVTPTVAKVDQTHYTVKVKLIRNVTYSFVFFAQKTGTYTFSDDKQTITIDYNSGALTNDDARDAFYAAELNYTVDGPFTKDITLRRPFAQVNFGSVKADYDAAVASKVAFDATLKTKISLKQAATVLNLLDGTTATPVDVTFAEDVFVGKTDATKFLTTSGAPASAEPVYYMAMAYVLASTDKEIATTVTLDVEGKQNGVDFAIQHNVANVPFQRNYRTNIIGDIFSVDGQFNVIIDPIYATPDYDYANTLQLELFKGGAVTVSEDVDLENQLVSPNVSTVLDMDGKTFSNTEDIWNESTGAWSLVSVQGGNFTVTGNGSFLAKPNDEYALDVRDGGTLVIENGTFNGNITAIYVHDGTLVVKGGTFDIQQLLGGSTNEAKYHLLLNCLDANYSNGTAKITVSGGRFHYFDPGNNSAEGAGTNFLAPGYKSVQDGEWFEVVPE